MLSAAKFKKMSPENQYRVIMELAGNILEEKKQIEELWSAFDSVISELSEIGKFIILDRKTVRQKIEKTKKAKALISSWLGLTSAFSSIRRIIKAVRITSKIESKMNVLNKYLRIFFGYEYSELDSTTDVKNEIIVFYTHHAGESVITDPGHGHCGIKMNKDYIFKRDYADNGLRRSSLCYRKTIHQFIEELSQNYS